MVGDVWVGNVFGHFCPTAIEVKWMWWKHSNFLVQQTELFCLFFFFVGVGFCSILFVTFIGQFDVGWFGDFM